MKTVTESASMLLVSLLYVLTVLVVFTLFIGAHFTMSVHSRTRVSSRRDGAR